MKTIKLIILTSCLYNTNIAQNVGIGLSNPTQARLVVNGAVGGQVALFQNVSGISLDGSTNPSIGFNYNNGRAIDAGPAAQLHLNSTGIKLKYFTSQNPGVTFSSPSSIFDYVDYRSFGVGQWLNVLYDTDSRLRVPDKLYNKANDNLNLLPLGAVYFKISNLHNGDNATVQAYNLGNNATFYNGTKIFNTFEATTIDPWMKLYLYLDTITKEYDDIFIVGAPNFSNDEVTTESAYCKFVRNASGADYIQIHYGAANFFSSTQVWGSLLIYGTKN